MAYDYLRNRHYYYRPYGPYYGRANRNDAEIRDGIRNRLVWDSWVDASQIEIEVSGGVVILSGEVDSIVEKRAAGDDAWDVVGVVDVINNLRVRQPAETAQ